MLGKMFSPKKLDFNLDILKNNSLGFWGDSPSLTQPLVEEINIDSKTVHKNLQGKCEWGCTDWKVLNPSTESGGL